MQNIFNPDNKFFSFMGQVADIIILNILFIITSLPIITIGASLAALYSVTLKQADGKEPYVAKTYLRAWAQNFRQGTILGLIMLGISALLLFNLSLKTSGGIYLAMRIGMTIALLFVIMISMYVFPLLSKFNNNIKQIIINAFLLSIRHFLTTCMLFLITGFFVYVTVTYANLFEVMIMFWFLFGFALVSRIQAQFFGPVFNRYIEMEQIEQSEPEEA